MLHKNECAIANIFALKLSTLSRKDKRWILKRLPKQQSDKLSVLINSISRLPINDDIYDQLSSELNFDGYFQQSKIEIMLDELNRMDSTSINSFLDSTDESVMKVMLLSGYALSWKKEMLNRLDMTEEDYETYLEENGTTNEKILAVIILYIHNSIFNN